MKISRKIPPEHRKVMLKVLDDVKEMNSQSHAFEQPDHYLQIVSDNYRRLNLSSIIQENEHKQKIGFKRLIEDFAYELRLISWWMWMLGRMTGKGKVIIHYREAMGVAAFAREDAIDALIQELRDRKNTFSNVVPQPLPLSKQQDEYSHDSMNLADDELSKKPWQGVQHEEGIYQQSGERKADDPRMDELFSYIDSLGLDEKIAGALMDNSLLRELIDSLEEANSAEVKLQEIESVLSELESSLASIQLPEIQNEMTAKIRQLKQAKQEMQIIAFLKNQLETSINIAFIHQIKMNPELYYMLPGLVEKGHDKIRLLATQLAHMQGIMQSQMNEQARQNLNAHNPLNDRVNVSILVNQGLSIHLDNVINLVRESLPDVAAQLSTLENTIKNAGVLSAQQIQQLELPANISGSLRLDAPPTAVSAAATVIFDVEKFIQETVKLVPQAVEGMMEASRPRILVRVKLNTF